MKIIDKVTGEEKIAIYAANSTGNMRYNVDGKFLTDKQFDKQFECKCAIAITCDECGWAGDLKSTFHRLENDEHRNCDQHECPKCKTVIINNNQSN